MLNHQKAKMNCMTEKLFALTCAALFLLLSGSTTTTAAENLTTAAATRRLGETNTVDIEAAEDAAAVATLEAVTPSTTSTGKLYIALGDSFSNGYNIWPFEEGTYTSSNDCQRSIHAYPHRIAENFGLDLSFHACTGVRTWSFFNEKLIEPNVGQLPQLEYLKEDASLVTFSVGGVDLGFLYAIVDCLWGYLESEPGNECYQEVKVNALLQRRVNRMAGKIQTPEWIYPLKEVYAEIQRRAPHATIVVVGYPRMFAVQTMCDSLSALDQQRFHDWIIITNSLIKDTAESFGFLYVDVFDVFEGHEECNQSLLAEAWVFPMNYGMHPGVLHPNKAGHEAIAKAVEAALYDIGFQ